MFGLGSPQTAATAATTAGNVGAGYGAGAAGVNSQLLPFLTRELNNPQGYTQQQQGAMLGAAEGGAGGSTAGLTTEANLASARNRNSGGFSGALDDAARQKDKALAGSSEGIAANDANLEQSQQQSAASGLSNMENMDTNAQLKAMGLIPEDVNAQANMNKNPDNWSTQLQSLNKGVGAGLGTLGMIFGG